MNVFTTHAILHFLAFLTTLYQFNEVLCFLEAPHLPNEAFISTGDLTIGGLYSAHEISGDRDKPCSGKITEFHAQQAIQSLVYAVNEVNSRQDILPNITLGYAIVDDCRYSITALGQATKFLPVSKCVTESCKPQVGEYPTHFDVIGVIVENSIKSDLVSRLLGIFNIPVISPSATSDGLSDKFNHAYFFRVVPPNRVQSRAILSLLTHFNWTYFSILYTSGPYGSNLYQELYYMATDIGLCLGYYAELHVSFGANAFDHIVQNLRKYKKAKAVVLFISWEHQKKLFAAIRRAGAEGEFIWMGGDAIDDTAFVGYEPEALGVISLFFPMTYLPHLESYFLQLNPTNNPENPWYQSFWQQHFGCSWTTSISSKTHCLNYPNISQADGYHFSLWTLKTIDSVYVYAHALHNLISDHCPEAFTNKKLLKDCTKGPILCKYLQKVSFQGITSYIRFDQEGEMIGDLVVKQLVKEGRKYEHKVIGIWINNGSQLHFETPVKWYLKANQTQNGEAIPESVCSEPCGLGEVLIQGEVSCCWDCHKCWVNQYVAENYTKCYDCPDLTWPDADTQTECLVISPTYLRWRDLFGIGLTALDVLGLSMLFAFSGLFIIYNDRVIVKASSKPLIGIIIVGLYLAFMTSLVLKIRPSTTSCSIGHFGYHISCTLIYGTLCTKTIRIYRIFQASKKLQRARVLMSINAQLIMIALIQGIQFIILFSTIIVNNTVSKSEDLYFPSVLVPSVAEHHMPAKTEEYVELRCDRSQLVLLTPFSFNLFLLLLCSAFAFLTRQLPDGFNESWYIFLSVITTLIIWITFIPTYFITFYAYHREALLSLALSLNAICNMICIFGPKVYALFWVDEESIETGFKDEATESKQPKKTTIVN